MGRTFLPPGFRFHPTDVELVLYYLKRKIMGKKLLFEAISELNIYKFSPWDLPAQSHLKTKDLEWFFFCPREKKYNSGVRMNRSTEVGYWKTTGRERPVIYEEKTVGMVKTLIFHEGNAPKGKRTDWVLHEYRIDDSQVGDIQDLYVLCKVFKKNGLGPRNGAQYGAPFNEEEWDNDEVCDGLAPLAAPLAVTNMVDPGCTSCLPPVEPDSSLSMLPTEEVAPNNQNSAVVASVDPGSSFIHSLPETSPYPSRLLHTNEPHLSNDNYPAVTSVINPGNASIQNVAEPDPYLTGPHPNESPPDDDEFARFLASFSDNSDLPPVENNEDINCRNQALNSETVPCVDGNDMYSALGNLDCSATLNGGGFNFSGDLFGYQSTYLQFAWDDASFLELNDLLIPVDTHTQGTETQPLVHENLCSSYPTFLNNGEHFNYGGNFSENLQFISTQSQQLQVQPNQYTQQATAMDFNPNRGYSTVCNYGFDTFVPQHEFGRDDPQHESGHDHRGQPRKRRRIRDSS